MLVGAVLIGAVPKIFAVDTTPPSTPGNFQVTSVGTGGLVVTWTASTDDVGVTAYEVFRDGVSQGTTTNLSMSLTGLTSTTAYSMGVEARDLAGNRSVRATIIATTATKPVAPSLAGGQSHSLAVKVDGSVWAWGKNDYGQLGDGTTTNRSAPVAVSGLTSGVAQVAAGDSHSVALKSDGTVWAWGWDYNGQLGDGSWGNYYSYQTRAC